MNTRTPSLRKFREYWIVRWGGRVRYLGKNAQEARQRYLNDPVDGLGAWAAWVSARADQRRAIRLSSPMTVLQLEQRFLDSRTVEGGIRRRQYYQKHLKRFVTAWGDFPAASVRVALLQRLKDEMIRRGKAPKTVNHDIGAVQTMFRWACDLELLPLVNLRGVKKLPLPELVDKSMSRAEVRKMIGKAQPPLSAWLALTYLAAMRPTETVHLVQGWGDWVETGVFAVANKARQNVRIRRHLLLSREALAWLPKAEPRWSRLDSFSQACRDALKQGPHRLRHSAATHLLALRVPRVEVDEILGHYASRVSLTYMTPRWKYLRGKVARLTLRKAKRRGS